MKHKNKFRILRKNRGFAILFALGILTVVLVVVMLFASKAKVSSTISAIHLENQSARTLAKSLVPRIMLTLNMSPSVQDQVLYSSIYDHQNNDLNKDYIDENLYSFDWIWKLEHPAHIKFNPTIGENSKVTEVGTFRYYMAAKKNESPEFSAQKPFVPTWQYILDIPSPDEESKVDGTLGNRKRGIIARFAFIIIPKVAHINPNAVADHTHCQMLSQASVKKSGLSHASCTKCARKLGNSPAELMFGAPEGLPAGTTATLLNTGDGYRMESPLAMQFENKNKKEKWTSIQNFGENFEELSVPGLGASAEEVDKYIANKNILTRFMDIDNSGDREAFWSDDGNPDEKDDKGKPVGEDDGIRDAFEFYHRFNMRRTDWNDLEISHIIADPVKWSDLGNKEPDISGSNNHNTGGIPWLANWDDKGTWDSKEDKRNQVIANLLNFCSPPSRKVVSNVDPSNWKTQNPKYTGLKRTLYINEYFYDLQFKSEVLLADYNDAIDKTDIEVAYKFNSQFMVELIDMYLNTLGDENNHPVKFEKNMQTPNFKAYKPEIYGKLSFEYMNPETGNYEQKEYDLEGLQFVRFEDTDKVQEIADSDKKYGYYGYYTDKTDEIKFTYQAAGEVSESAVYQKTKIKNVKLKIDKILLYRNPTTTEKKGTSPIDKTFPGSGTPTDMDKEYVDCAIINYTETIVAPGNLTNADALYAICGDREVIDPRQNLRLKDWSSSGNTYKRYLNLASYNTGVKTLHTLPIQTYSLDENGGSLANAPTVTNRTLAIAANNPRSPKSSQNTRDCEAAEDPSWRLNGGIKVEPNSFATHISTAYIRHAILRESQNNYSVLEHPMESLWELGAIHRAEKWQTLNISKSPAYESAKDFVKQGAGDYEDGDAPILDQVKMTNDCLAFGKVNLIRHVDTDVRDTVIGALFRDMPVQQFGYYLSQGLDDNGIEDLTLFPNKSYENTWLRIHDQHDPDSGRANPTVSSVDKEQWYHTSYVAALYDVLYGDFGNSAPLKKDENDPKEKNKFWRRSDFLAAPKSRGGAAVDVKDILYPIRQDYGYITDAMEEQIIGRTINLMKIDSTVKGATAILVVQTIKDSGNDITVFKDWDSNGVIAGSKKTPEDSMIAHHQAGYRRFADLDDNDPSFFKPPKTHYEQIQGFKGSYQNGADAITGETKVIITLDFNTALQKWEMVKYEYAD